jgi:protein gp37
MLNSHQDILKSKLKDYKMSKIEWTEKTWNPATGCTKISAGCKNCYAEIMTRRLKAMGQEKYQYGFEFVKTHPQTLDEPVGIKKPTMFFVNSMSDLFHKDIPVSYIKRVFKVMNDNPRHTFQVLTKRAKRISGINDKLYWSKNIWMGVSVEDRKSLKRVDHLKKCGASVKFLSIEPLLEPLPDLDLDGIDWVIVGGESGPGARPIEADWVRSIRDHCIATDTAFFFKQWGGFNKKKAGKLLDEKIWNQMPQLIN